MARVLSETYLFTMAPSALERSKKVVVEEVVVEDRRGERNRDRGGDETFLYRGGTSVPWERH